MKSSETTLHTLILMPVAAALVGMLFLLGVSQLHGRPGTPSAKVESRVVAGVGDSARHFQVAGAEQEMVSFAI